MEEILLNLGFHEDWVNLVMQCGTTDEYSIHFNSIETGTFKPTRGLRQGDPLSRYLFLLCMEDLTALLAHEEEAGNLLHIKVYREASLISNFMFADDSLILIKAHMDNAQTLKRILDLYCAASGQLLSLDKSIVFFGPNTDVNVKVQILCFIEYHDRSAH